MDFLDTAHVHQIGFRQRLVNFYANYRDHHQFLTLGALLHEVKTKKAYGNWRTFSLYCQKELHIVPVYSQNLFICAFLRLKAFSLSIPEMNEVQSRYSLKRVLQVSKFATNKVAFFQYLADQKFTVRQMQNGRSRRNAKRKYAKFFPLNVKEKEYFDLSLDLLKEKGMSETEAKRLLFTLPIFILGKKSLTIERVREICAEVILDYDLVSRIL